VNVMPSPDRRVDDGAAHHAAWLGRCGWVEIEQLAASPPAGY
jgi:hypothetical protein